jgi:hypothetical protein
MSFGVNGVPTYTHLRNAENGGRFSLLSGVYSIAPGIVDGGAPDGGEPAVALLEVPKANQSIPPNATVAANALCAVKEGLTLYMQSSLKVKEQ